MAMSSTLQALGIDRMSVEERIALAREILDSVIDVPTTEPSTLSEAKQEELRRRLETFRANRDDVISWAEIDQAAKSRYGE